MNKLIVSTVQAEPGWKVVFKGTEDDPRMIIGNSIIAWVLEVQQNGEDDPNVYPHAVTIDGVEEEVYGYLRPDGRVEVVFGGVADSIEQIEAGYFCP